MFEYETLEEFSVVSKVSDTVVKVRLRRQLNHQPTRFNAAPYCLDLQVGSICYQQDGIDEIHAREATVRFLLEHVNGIAPPKH